MGYKLCACWWLWRQRNQVIFRGETMGAEILGTKIVQEGGLWQKFS